MVAILSIGDRARVIEMVAGELCGRAVPKCFLGHDGSGLILRAEGDPSAIDSASSRIISTTVHRL